MRIPGKDKRTYEVDHVGEADDYEVRLDGQLVGGFRLEPKTTKAWIQDGSPTHVTSKLIEALADELVDRGGAVMKML